MNEYEQQIKEGKVILRSKGINFSAFKSKLPNTLNGTTGLSEDDWVEYYNLYARSVGAKSFETVHDWAMYFFQSHNKKEHSLWLKK